MENFFYDGEYYRDITEFANYIFNSEQEIQDLPDDHLITCFESELRKPIQFDADIIAEALVSKVGADEFGEELINAIKKFVNEKIDIKALNDLIPEYYIETGKAFQITKQDLLDNY